MIVSQPNDHAAPLKMQGKVKSLCFICIWHSVSYSRIVCVCFRVIHLCHRKMMLCYAVEIVI